MKKLLFVLGILSPIIIGATNIDSLRVALSTVTEDSSKVNILIELARQEKTKAQDDLKYIDRAISLAQKTDYLKGEGEALFIKADIHYSKLRDVESAVEYFKKAAKVLHSINQVERAGDAYNNAGTLMQDLSEYEESHKYLRLAEAIRDSLQLSSKLAQTLSNIAITYLEQGKINKAEEYHMRALKIRKGGDDLKGLAQTYNNLVNLYGVQKKHDLAIEYANKALEIYQNLNEPMGIAIAHLNVGNTYNEKGDYKKAMEGYVSATKIFEEINVPRGVQACVLGMAAVLEKQLLFEEAKEYLRKSLDMSIRLNSKKNIAHSYNNIAKLILKQDSTQIDSSLFYYQKALEIYEEIGDEEGISRGLSNVGTNYWKKGNYEKAVPYLEKAIRLNEKNGVSNRSVTAYISLGKHHLKRNEPQQAIPYFEKALAIAEETEEIHMVEGANQSLSKAHAMLEDYKKAYRYKLAASEYRDSLYNEDKVKAVNEVKVAYEVEKKDKKAELNRVVISRQRTMLSMSVLGLLLTGVIIFLIGRQNRLRKKANLALADKNEFQIKTNRELEEKNEIIAQTNEKLEVKNTEIKHRTGNSFTTIISLLRLQKRNLESDDMKQVAVEMENRVQAITILSKLLDSTPTNKVNISKYLKEICDNLEQTNPNYYQNLKVNLNIEDMEIDGQYASDIGLITNELMTNSFKHAFAETASPQISITFKKSAPDVITMQYQDNGRGIPVEVNIKESKSMGLKLVHRLTNGLDGTVEVKKESGLIMEFKFPEQKLTA